MSGELQRHAERGGATRFPGLVIEQDDRSALRRTL
jgi:hypothetical protein